METAGKHPHAGGLHFLPHGVDFPHHRHQDLGRGWRTIGLVDAQQVLAHTTLNVQRSTFNVQKSGSSVYTNGGLPDRHGHSP
jgi:hypothetical protein